jgi:ADP-ribose pyrophosphatase
VTWTIEHEQTVFEAKPFLRVDRQRIRTDRGQEVSDFYQIILPDFALICPVSEQGDIITLWQYKHGARQYGLTFPGGVINDGELPELSARRELLEETGYQAGHMLFLGRFACNGNQGCGFAHFFAAADCKKAATADSGDLEVMDLRLMKAAEIEEALRTHAIGCLADAALWGLVRSAGIVGD